MVDLTSLLGSPNATAPRLEYDPRVFSGSVPLMPGTGPIPVEGRYAPIGMPKKDIGAILGRLFGIGDTRPFAEQEREAKLRGSLVGMEEDPEAAFARAAQVDPKFGTEAFLNYDRGSGMRELRADNQADLAENRAARQRMKNEFTFGSMLKAVAGDEKSYNFNVSKLKNWARQNDIDVDTWDIPDKWDPDVPAKVAAPAAMGWNQNQQVNAGLGDRRVEVAEEGLDIREQMLELTRMGVNLRQQELVAQQGGYAAKDVSPDGELIIITRSGTPINTGVKVQPRGNAPKYPLTPRGQTPPKNTPTPAPKIPPGAIMGTMGGKRGYRLGNMFYPL